MRLLARSAVLALVSGLMSALAFAAEPQLIESDALQAKKASQVYIVQLREDPISSYTGGVTGIPATKPAKGKKLDHKAANVKKYFDHLGRGHDRVLADVGATEKVYGYCYSFNGFAARLTPAQVSALKSHTEVVRVWKDELRKPLTDNTPDYLNLTGGKGPWIHDLTGEDIIVGVIDSGVWPEHPSFADVKTPKKGNKGKKIPYDDPPAEWTGAACDFGNAAYNPLDADFECNNKLLGATFYNESFTAASDLLPEEYDSARDQDGHGSHVGATAAGNARVDASIAGEQLGEVSGMAPRARVAVYKVCWNGSFPPAGFLGGCFSSDSMAAIDQAVADGVDVINFSIGGASTAFGGPDDIAFLFAADAGVFVAAAQGNDGPDAGTTGTPAGVPWLTSVGAGQDNQVFNIGVDIATAAPGVSGIYEAVEAAISIPLEVTGPVQGDLIVVDAVDDGSGNPSNQGCSALINGDQVAGNIALISRGSCAFSTKILNAQAAGATGVIVFNNDGDPIVMGGDPTGITLPAVMIGQNDGELLEDTINSGDGVLATMSNDILINKANTVATFSSRGPNGGSPDIIKPDITGPGVQILAAQTPTPNDGQAPGELFQLISGTSMSSPHVAGIGALLKQAQPDWTPEIIRSAMMTTALQNMSKTFSDTPADPFDVGAGLVSARDALNPGLAYQTNIVEYIQYLCGEPLQQGIISPDFCAILGAIDPSDLNLPSIGVAELVGSQTVTRTVTNVIEHPGQGNKPPKATTFAANVSAPAGVDVTVNPDRLSLVEGESGSFEVTFTTNANAVPEQWQFGQLVWDEVRGRGDDDDDSDSDSDSDGKGSKHLSVQSPLAVRAVAASFPVEVFETDAGADGRLSFDVGVGLPGSLNTNAGGLAPAEIQPDEVGTGGATLHFFSVPPGTRLARISLFDESVGDGSGSDDLDLQIQGPDTAGFPFVAFSGSPTSNEQVDMVDPAPGLYAAFVIHFATVNDPTPYDLHVWTVGPNLGNVQSSSPGAVTVGDVVPIDVDWNGLTPETKYRGLVEISNDNGEVGFTVLSIDTAP